MIQIYFTGMEKTFKASDEMVSINEIKTRHYNILKHWD